MNTQAAIRAVSGNSLVIPHPIDMIKKCYRKVQASITNMKPRVVEI